MYRPSSVFGGSFATKTHSAAAAVRYSCFSSNHAWQERVPEVRFEFSDFCFEITSLSDFTTPDFEIPDSGFPIPQGMRRYSPRSPDKVLRWQK
jgi:hypothetical protein